MRRGGGWGGFGFSFVGQAKGLADLRKSVAIGQKVFGYVGFLLRKELGF